MGFEPTTPTLARLCSTSELRPHPILEGKLNGGWIKCKINWQGAIASPGHRTRIDESEIFRQFLPGTTLR